jgi:hypothetical protein
MKARLLNQWGLAILLVAASSAGCKSFDSEWSATCATPQPSQSIQGAWIGTWQNTNNTHHGQLRAVLSKKSETNYTAHFHATWGSHSGGFTTQLKGQWDNDAYRFEGRKRILGFLIVTRGDASATNLFSVYESRFDNGTFTLRRPLDGER